MNIQRSPLGGRGFESFSEDPVLSGNMASEYIKGVQSKGVAATPKHFVSFLERREREMKSCVTDLNLLATRNRLVTTRSSNGRH